MTKFFLLASFGILLSFGSFAQQANTVTSGSGKKLIPIAQYYKGGQDSMYAFINRKLIYPVMARKNRIQGECIISVTLNEDGTLSNHQIVKNIGGGCGDEALRIVKMLRFEKPGFKVQYSLPVIFKL